MTNEAFEQWYVENAFDYVSNPIGSRDCGLQRKAWNASREAAEKELAEIRKQEPVRMGFGKVAVGSCKDPEDGTPGIIYLPLDFPRAFDSDTTDVYPVGSAVPRSKFLACIYFHSPETLQQSIDVLLEIQKESYPATAAKPGFVMADDDGPGSAYMELIYAVQQKFPGETRHQTALRYIRERELASLSSGIAAAQEEGK